MNWWLLFASLNLLAVVGNCALVPQEYRMRYFQAPKDATCYMAAFLTHAIWAIALVQQITAPEPFPDWVRFTGAGFFVAGHLLVIWARRVNPYAMPTIAIPDRLVRVGPYRVMAHPMYVGLAYGAKGSCLLLGQPLAIWPMLFYIVLLAYRMHVEERTLSAHFQDYP